MKIISRYVLKEHVGPLLFSLTALTSLMLINFISRQVGELVGKGLPWSVIGEFVLLAVPFTVALTVPMSVLVAVLYAFSRLASENEVTAMKASGVSPWMLVAPSIVGGLVMTILLLAFNDQVLPRSNHRLKTLQDNISQTKPTLLLNEQVINSISEGKFYLKAGKIDNSTGEMKEVVIYDLADPMRRRTIYAESGKIAFSANRVDLHMDLSHGEMQEVSTDTPSQLDRLFYEHDRIRVPNVGQIYDDRQGDPQSKGDREMGICEMQQRLWQTENHLAQTREEYERARLRKPDVENTTTAFPAPLRVPEPRGIGWAYCTMLSRVSNAFGVKEAQAQEPAQAQGQVPAPTPQDTAKRPVVSVTQTPALVPGAVTNNPVPTPQPGQALTQEQVASQAARELMRGTSAVPQPAASPAPPLTAEDPRLNEAKIRMQLAERQRNRYAIEIHKKFSLAAACLIFTIMAPPIALRFPRGGVGLVIAVSLGVFALYYVGLIGGEALANKAYVPPFWAMWGTNVIMTLIGLVMLLRMGHDSSGRGGGLREWLDERRVLRAERRAARSARPA